MSINKHIDQTTDQHDPSEIELGLLQMQILWMLGRKSTHGYELMKALNELKKTTITQGTLYPTLQRLERLGLIVREYVGRKIVYHVTPQGRSTMNNACMEFSRTFFGIFHDFVCGKCDHSEMRHKEKLE